MSKGTYLRQKGTGRIYPWSPPLAKRKDMTPCDLPGKKGAGVKKEAEPKPKAPEGDKDPEQPADTGGENGTDQEVESGGESDHDAGTDGENEQGGGETGERDLSNAIVVNDQVVSISKASRDVLADYAERHFGASLDRRKKAASLAEELRALIAEHGHPDADD